MKVRFPSDLLKTAGLATNTCLKVGFIYKIVGASSFTYHGNSTNIGASLYTVDDGIHPANRNEATF